METNSYFDYSDETHEKCVTDAINKIIEGNVPVQEKISFLDEDKNLTRMLVYAVMMVLLLDHQIESQCPVIIEILRIIKQKQGE